MKQLSQAPHRLYFFLGLVALLSLLAWWWINLQFANQLPVPLHGILMPLGVFPLFILGFTFTAGPRWLNVKASTHHFILHGATYFVGIVLVLFASTFGLKPLRLSGFALMLSAWVAVTLRWARLIIESKSEDKKHAIALLVAMLGGILSMLCALLWAAGSELAWQAARQLSFFAFLLPIFLTVCHRMLPFFTANVLQNYVTWRPYSLLATWLIGSWTLAFAGIFGTNGSDASSAAQGIQVIVATLLSFSFANTSWRWGLFRSFENRLLAMLHLSFAWLSVVFALHAISALGVTTGSATTHALALGFMSTMLVAFVSRVSFGHSGRPLHAGNGLWSLYLALHLAAVLRVFASFQATDSLIKVSAGLWAAVFIAWGALMLPIYLRPRVDGAPG
ncbi:NnrS family protein [Undibacterium cyanobacteriorum]|uniref:NnrS family protein n=1 Tax=Undibacterium cyanobacteriorum TaxID=3073561 RepID=A0ABY9RLJ2_9BURK|nr:NnrS family protein [Undibacterium sp. 20NA77.5]WMW82088.1 NnrS family protein [Undibacterium sp. 20NA77.5]